MSYTIKSTVYECLEIIPTKPLLFYDIKLWKYLGEVDFILFIEDKHIEINNYILKIIYMLVQTF